MMISPQTNTPLNWSGSDGTAPKNTFHIQPAENLEVQNGIEFWKGGEHGSGPSVSRDTFPLPTLGPRLEDLARTLHYGSGFAVLRGLELAKTPEDNMIILLGISSYVGSQRGAQNKKRDIITHITDSKDWSNVPHNKRHGIHTNSALPFHNDMGAEILTLQYRQVARHGGATSVVSATRIFNDLAARHPDVLQTLMAPEWPVQLSANPVRFADLPLLAVQKQEQQQYHHHHHHNNNNGRVVISVDPGRLGLHPATAGVRPEGCELSQTQIKALDVLAGLADKHAISVAARPGDILFINNLALLHKRDAYLDTVDTDDDDDNNNKKAGITPTTGGAIKTAALTRRHLVRLWLRNPDMAWEIPEAMKAPWRAAYGPREGFGRFLEDRYEVVPVKDYKVPKYSAGSAAWLIDYDEEATAVQGDI